ncbi:NADPH dehydrogenase NamA [Clostridium sp. DJ247]|uniref:NADPH dehydrogenase NamA n=1 Tax=Clostridium sp. DJ247 TaxID=2726188 RepID=UPI001629CC55|nr:NADPH dehydrogenase NamA [Clostridium sp. DJ247]MBC2581043.1 NADPH dehydrogenase NamA [Clostridium sp. DJ247]
MSKLFSKFKVKNLEIKNRIVMPPMCMYSSDNNGSVKPWHYVHYVTRAIGGVGLIIVEATAVEGRGRISDRDLGIWDDSHIDGLKSIVDEVKKHGAKIGIQLGHAGRKCEVHSEQIIAPSAIAFNDKYKTPKEMSKEDIVNVIRLFKDAALRAEKAGFDVIEIHGAHGYLINEFMSPLSNKREDEYGGNIENRARFLKEITKAVREVWPKEKPLILRVSAEDFVEEGNHDIDTAKIINLVKDEGIDIINVSSGAVVSAHINVYPGYQVKYAETIKRECSIPVMAGGLITTASMVEEILQNDRADLVYIGRELLRNPYWVLHAASELGEDYSWPSQYDRAR